MKIGKLVLFCLTLALMVAGCCGPVTTTTSTTDSTTSATDSIVIPQPKYAEGQYVWIDGVTKAYVYAVNGYYEGSSSDGIGISYYVTYAQANGEHNLNIRENRLFATPDTFYHKIVVPEQLYQQIVESNDSLLNMMITTQEKLKDIEIQNQINNTWLSHFESHSRITDEIKK